MKLKVECLHDVWELLALLAGDANSVGDSRSDLHERLVARDHAAYWYGRKDGLEDAMRLVTALQMLTEAGDDGTVEVAVTPESLALEWPGGHPFG